MMLYWNQTFTFSDIFEGLKDGGPCHFCQLQVPMLSAVSSLQCQKQINITLYPFYGANGRHQSLPLGGWCYLL